MRVIIYYVIPIVAVLLVLVLLYVRSRNPPVSGDDKPAISTPVLIVVLGVGGAVGVFAVAYALDFLGFL
ncbi:MAG: hypothetical protein OXG05_08435 [Gammaproteobacteria bacterium]|nr:hypothetical protein [Gammaproteobacteria bacterium]